MVGNNKNLLSQIICHGIPNLNKKSEIFQFHVAIRMKLKLGSFLIWNYIEERYIFMYSAKIVVYEM